MHHACNRAGEYRPHKETHLKAYGFTVSPPLYTCNDTLGKLYTGVEPLIPKTGCQYCTPPVAEGRRTRTRERSDGSENGDNTRNMQLRAPILTQPLHNLRPNSNYGTAGVMHSGSGYLVVLGKLLRGSSVTGSSTPGDQPPRQKAHFLTVLSSWVNIIMIGGCF